VSLDVLYLSCNRREFTAFTFAKLIENTNWDRVDRLIVYDDSSTDGALEEIASRIEAVPVPHEIREHNYRSPVSVMNDYVAQTESRFFAKVDNDVVMPPGWLDAFVSVMTRKSDPELNPELLGGESPFMGPPLPDWNGTYTWHAWKHIGGVGLMDTDFFRRTGPMKSRGHHGFTEHQWEHEPRRGWINPDIPMCLLDRCPIEPWHSIGREYERQGWQRPWKKIPKQFDFYWRWFTPEVVT
jgi:glycosyltransferase involved in cell wall biosynthesis